MYVSSMTFLALHTVFTIQFLGPCGTFYIVLHSLHYFILLFDMTYMTNY